MKRCIVLFLTALVLILSACGNSNEGQPFGETGTLQSETPSATATPTPDFSATDFSGRWYVFEIIDSNGLPVSDAFKLSLGAGFILELLQNSTYFVYNADGKALGQGAYSVALNQMTLTAQGTNTVYEIVDADTLRITEPDTSVTVMKRETDEVTEDSDTVIDEVTEDGDTVIDEVTEDGDIEDDVESDPPAEATVSPDASTNAG